MSGTRTIQVWAHWIGMKQPELMGLQILEYS